MSPPSFFWGPPEASSTAHATDTLFFALLGLTGAIALVVTVLTIVFVVRYRRGSRADRSHPPASMLPLEIGWAVLPLLIFIGIFIWAAYGYSSFYRARPDAMVIYIVGKQWMWKVQHGNGRREIDEVHLPLGHQVRLVMIAQDVIHSFFVPAFRVKQDLLPGRYTSLVFTPTREGTYDLFCAEYCGTEHSHMRGQVIVMRPDRFAAWLQAGERQPDLAERGFELFRHFGCSGCHDPRSTVHAPRLRGLFGSRVHLQDGRSVVADENYLRDSVLEPKKDIVAGFAPIMPSFSGQIDEEQLNAIVEYLRSIGPE